MAHDVFISHSIKDKTTADAVCATLESNGVRCWIAPRDVSPGREWSECIIEAIKKSRIMVLVFTANSNESPQIRREVERAVNHGVVILPLRVDNIVPSSALEYFIGNVHWLDALTPPLEKHLLRLCGSVKSFLAAAPAPPGPVLPEQPVETVPAGQKEGLSPSTDSPDHARVSLREAPAEPPASASAAFLSPAWLRRLWIFGLCVLAAAITIGAILFFLHKPSPGESPSQVTASQPGKSEPASIPAQTPVPVANPAHAPPSNLKTKVNADDGLTYVFIPPGTFQMGCSPNDSECGNGEKPVHSVTISAGFWIGQTPVTGAAYKQITGTNPSYFRGDRIPVHVVSWNEAQTYCGRVGMRLPTEAEWEYAARGGTAQASYGPLDQIAWDGDNSGGAPHDVGLKQPNSFGLYDMLGDVQEWAADWYGPYDGLGATDPKGPPNGQFRVVRGGSWGDDASIVRASVRRKIVPGGLGNLVGFRCAGN